MLPPFCNGTLNPVTIPALCFRSSCLQRDERCSKETSHSASGGTNETQFPAGLPLVVGFSDVWSGVNSDEKMPRTQGFPSGFLLPGGFSSVSLRLNTCRGLALSRAVRRVLVLHLIALFHRIFLDRIYQPQLNVVKAGQRVQASLGGKVGGRYTHKTDCKCLFFLWKTIIEVPLTCKRFLFQAGAKPNGHKLSAQPMNIRLPYHEEARSMLLSLPPAPPRVAAQAGDEGNGTQSPIAAPAPAITGGRTQTRTQESRTDEDSEAKTRMCEGVCTNRRACTW